MARLLEISGISLRFAGVRALTDVSLHVEKGELFSIIGPNGAGKTSIVNCISGRYRPQEGRILFEGRDITALPTHAIMRLGLAQAPEGRRVFPRMSVLENLVMGAQAAGHDPGEDLEAIFALFPRLRERQAQRGGTLSGGEQQMLAIGRALMSKPRLLLLDEPFLGLAPLVVSQIEVALDNLRASGLTMLIVEQKLELALAFAQRAYVLIKGEIVLEEGAATLARRPDLADLYFSISSRASARSTA